MTTRQPSKLDLTQPYGTSHGAGPVRHFQNGKEYDHKGDLINGVDDRRPAGKRKRKDKV